VWAFGRKSPQRQRKVLALSLAGKQTLMRIDQGGQKKFWQTSINSIEHATYIK
jgi:hypothetical protein